MLLSTSLHILQQLIRVTSIWQQGRRTDDLDRQLRPVIWARGDVLDLAKREHPIDDLAEDDMFAVEEVAFCGCDEELQVQSQRSFKVPERSQSLPDSRLYLVPNWPVFSVRGDVRRTEESVP